MSESDLNTYKLQLQQVEAALTTDPDNVELTQLKGDLEQVLKEVDSDGSGVIDYTEWIASTLNRRLYIQEDVLWSAFKVFDRDGNGKISKQELQNILQSDPTVTAALGKDSSIDDIMKEVDRNNDGEIDFDEFMIMMRGEGMEEIGRAHV